jgi:hypothetical protein
MIRAGHFQNAGRNIMKYKINQHSQSHCSEISMPAGKTQAANRYDDINQSGQEAGAVQ